MTGTPEPALRITGDMLLSRRLDFERRMRRAPPVTLATIAVLALVFLAGVAQGALASRRGIVAACAIVGGLMTPLIDNGAHVGGALGGALVARRLYPVVLAPLSAAQAATARRRLWLVAAVLAYTAWGWAVG